jgi:hypothetical protein
MDALERMRPSRRRGRRVASFWLLLAQFAAAVAIPAADALLEARASSESVHVESAETECATHHDELYCQTVRSLAGQVGARTPQAAAGTRAVVLVANLSASSVADPRAVPGAPVGPRAPPRV